MVTVAIQGEADPQIETLGTPVHWVKIGQMGRCVRLFREAGVRRAVMAGQVKHKKVFQSLVPDRLLLRVLRRMRARNTVAILGAVAEVLAEEGVELVDSTTFLRSMRTEEGALSRRRPTTAQREDVRFGFSVARELARLDIGQTVVVKGKAVVAVEAMEGTDETIRRAGGIVDGGLTVVKVARPAQDMRFDVPVAGPRTIEVMKDAGAVVLALEAGKSLLLEREKLLRLADEAGIVVLGMSESLRDASADTR